MSSRFQKSKNKIGVACVTAGPGATNAIPGLAEAYVDSAPIIVFSGQVPLKSIGSLAFQECPATELTKSFTKWSYLLQIWKLKIC